MAPRPLNATLFSADVREFLAVLDKHGVRYLLVGGGAVIYYGFPRLTGDMDFFCDANVENATRLFRALQEFWGGNIPNLDRAEELTAPDLILQFGVPPNRIDVITKIDGVNFADAWPNRLPLELTLTSKTVTVPMIGLTDLIKNKVASARPKDLEDLKFLQRAIQKR